LELRECSVGGDDEALPVYPGQLDVNLDGTGMVMDT
jgi:hypothetical protein